MVAPKQHKHFIGSRIPEHVFLLKLRRVRERRTLSRYIRLFFKRLISRGLYLKAFGFSRALAYLIKRRFRERPFNVFRSLVRLLMPAVQLRAFRKSGTTHLLPFLFRSQTRPISLAVTWFLRSARDRLLSKRRLDGNCANLVLKLFDELQDVHNFTGGSFSKRQAWHSLAARNNAIRYFSRRRFRSSKRVFDENVIFDNQLLVSAALKERAFRRFAFLGFWLKTFSSKLHACLKKLSVRYKRIQRFFVFCRWSFYYTQYIYLKSAYARMRACVFLSLRNFVFNFLNCNKVKYGFSVQTLKLSGFKSIMQFLLHLCLRVERVLHRVVNFILAKAAFFRSKAKFKQLFMFLGKRFMHQFVLLWTGHLFRKNLTLDFRLLYSKFKVHTLRLNSFYYGHESNTLVSYQFRPFYESIRALDSETYSYLSNLNKSFTKFSRIVDTSNVIFRTEAGFEDYLTRGFIFRRFIGYNKLVSRADQLSAQLGNVQLAEPDESLLFACRKNLMGLFTPTMSLFQMAQLRVAVWHSLSTNSDYLRRVFLRLRRIYLRYSAEGAKLYDPNRQDRFKKVKEAVREIFYPYRFHLKLEPYFDFWIPFFNLYLRRFIAYFKYRTNSLRLKPMRRLVAFFDKRNKQYKFLPSYSNFHELVLPLHSFLELIPDWRLRERLCSYLSSTFFLWYRRLFNFKLLPYWDKCKLMQRYVLIRRFKSGPLFFKRSFFLLNLLRRLLKRSKEGLGSGIATRKFPYLLNVPVFPLRKRHYTIPFPEVAFFHLDFNGYLTSRLSSFIFPRFRWSKETLFRKRVRNKIKLKVR